MKKIVQLFGLLPQLFRQRATFVDKTIIKGHIANRISNKLVITSESPAYFFSKIDRDIPVEKNGNFEVHLPIQSVPIQFTLHLDQSISVTELFIEPGQQLSIRLDARRPNFAVFKSKDSSAYNNTVGHSYGNRLKASKFTRLLGANLSLLPEQFCAIIDQVGQEELRFWENQKTRVSRAYYQNRYIHTFALLAALKDSYARLYTNKHAENNPFLPADYWDFIQTSPTLHPTHLSSPHTTYLINLQLEVLKPGNTPLRRNTDATDLLNTASTLYTGDIREFALAHIVQRTLSWEQDCRKVEELMSCYHGLGNDKNYAAYLDRQYLLFQTEYRKTGS